jgi:hypothetical protein
MNETERESGNVVEGVVRRVRLRRRGRRLADLTLFVAAAALGALAIGRLAGIERLWGVPFVPVVLAAAALMLAVGAVLIAVATADLGRTARHTEAAAGLSERLSSVLEVRRDRERYAGPIAGALFRDAAARARMVDTRAAAPLAGRPTAIAGAALVLAGAAFLFVPAAGQNPAVPVSAEADVPADTRTSETLADEITQMADLLAADAERRDSGYLEAVANSLRELAENADSLSQEELAAEFAALTEHAALGYGDDAPEWMPGSREEFAGIGERMDAFETAMAERAARIAAAGPNIEGARTEMIFDDYENEVRRDQALAPGSPEAAMGNSAFDMADVDPNAPFGGESLGGGEFNLQPMEEQMLRPAGAQPLGAAMNSGRGASRIAGGGTQDILENSDYLEAEFARGDDMIIAAEETGEGNRIRIQIDPEASLSEVADGAAAGSAGWQQQGEVAVTRESVAPSERAVVARYFGRAATSTTTGL